MKLVPDYEKIKQMYLFQNLANLDSRIVPLYLNPTEINDVVKTVLRQDKSAYKRQLRQEKELCLLQVINLREYF